MDWLTGLTTWLLDLVKTLWSSFTDFLDDFWLGIADAILSALAGTITAIPSPGFLSAISVGSLLNQLPSDITYFMSFLPFSQGFALISAGVAFRIARKLATLFQW